MSRGPQTGPTGPCGLEIYASNYSAWALGIEDKGRGIKDSPFEQLLAAKNKIEVSAPEDFQYGTVRHVFKYNKFINLHEQIDKCGRVNVLGIDEFLDHPLIKPLLEDVSICNALDFYDKPGPGRRAICMEAAIEAARNYDPANRPPRSLPGPRVRPPPPEPSSPEARGSKSTECDPQTGERSAPVDAEESTTAGPSQRRRLRFALAHSNAHTLPSSPDAPAPWPHDLCTVENNPARRLCEMKTDRQAKQRKRPAWVPLTWQFLNENRTMNCTMNTCPQSGVRNTRELYNWCLCDTDYECLPHVAPYM